jgi:hypothetical protein
MIQLLETSVCAGLTPISNATGQELNRVLAPRWSEAQHNGEHIREVSGGSWGAVSLDPAADPQCHQPLLEQHDQQSQAFMWTADPDKIIAAVRRGH